MTRKEIAEIIHKEFTVKELGVTQQYLDIHEPLYEDGLPKVERIDTEKDEIIIAYLPVKNEYFSFAVYMDEDQKIFNIGTESRNIVSLIATSDTMSVNDILCLSKLKPSKTWNKGDYRNNNMKATHKNSGIEFEPNPEPDEFEDKLKRLLIFLKQDEEGVKSLANIANGYINVLMDFHAGNQHMGSPFIDRECVKVINDLNLEISFDLWAWGNKFK